MNDVKLLPKLIKRLRKDKKLSQFQIATLLKIPSSTYSMIESGHRKPNDDILISLSNILEFDFITFSEKISSYKSLEHYLLANELIRLLNSNDVSVITPIFNIFKTNPLISEFNYGEPEIIKIYCNTLIWVHIDKNVELAYTTCRDFLNITKLDEFQPKINMPKQYYSLILNLGYCLYSKKLYDDYLTLYKILMTFLENLYFKSDVTFIHTPSFYEKYYIICLNNLADVHFVLNNLNLALELCNKGINTSNNFNKISILPILLRLKVEILCKLNNYSDAKLAYVQYKSLCEITNKLKHFETSTNFLKTHYKNLFN